MLAKPVATGVATACAVLPATWVLTHFFAPSETDGVLGQFWTLSVPDRFLFVAGMVALPILLFLFSRLLWGLFKGLIGWDYPDRSVWFIGSRGLGLAMLAGVGWCVAAFVLGVWQRLIG